MACKYDTANRWCALSSILFSPTILLLYDVTCGSPDDEFQEYLSNLLTDFGENCYNDAYYASQSDGWPKISKFQNQYSGRQPSWKSNNCDISKTVWLILLKFRMMTHICSPELTSCSKIKFLKIEDGRQPPFWQLLNAMFQQPFDQFWWNLYGDAH